MNIFLIGFMGSGKSSFGKKLARKLSKDFIDLDEWIESKEGKSISQIFSDHGEAHFRKTESALLSTIDSEKNAVVALGGGAPCNKINWSHIRKNGILIYLKESESILFGRLKQNKSTRPLVSSLNDAELRVFIQEKLKERSEYYEQADFVYEKNKTGFEFLIDQLTNYTR